ncbi:MAG: ABC transporter ATP-binding protein, partial [Sulfitobacter litoralis]|nr:ABC transporter ATP-binding protein [Sulfitobacter litoralis]
MFRFFENLVDPYADYAEQDTPPTRLWPFFRSYSGPFKTVFWVTGVLSIVVAAIEIGLIYYMGRLVDLMESSPAEVWRSYGAEFIVVALLILIARPAVQAAHVLLLNNAVLPNYGTLFRWRGHRQVLRQSVGWFEDDFAGRIANRTMQ